MKALTKVLALCAALAVSTSLAYADPVLGAGAIGIGPNYTTPTQALINWNSTGISYSGGNAVVNVASGSLASFLGDSADVFGFSFSQISAADPFEMYTANGPDQLQFYLTSLTVETDNATTLLLEGTGYFAEAGYADTLANLTLSASAAGSGDIAITNYESTSAIAPEPGSLLLLGTGLLFAAEVARRKFAA